MKKRTTITTRKYEVWIIGNGSEASEKEKVENRESEPPHHPEVLLPEPEADDPPLLTGS